MGNNQSGSNLWNMILFSCSIYLHLFEIAICLWLGSIGDTTEFQFAFRSKITWNFIFEASNCRRIILIFSLSEELHAVSVVSFATFIWSHYTTRSLSTWRCATTPKNDWEGNSKKCGTDAFYSCLGHFFFSVYCRPTDPNFWHLKKKKKKKRKK